MAEIELSQGCIEAIQHMTSVWTEELHSAKIDHNRTDLLERQVNSACLPDLQYIRNTTERGAMLTTLKDEAKAQA